jgi:hypothetical protein
MRASRDDDTPAVRSAACRAVGVIVGFPQVSKRYKRLSMYRLPFKYGNLGSQHFARNTRENIAFSFLCF